MGVKQKDAGLDDELAITAQGLGLGSDDVRVPGEIEVVVAIEAHRVRTGRASVQQRAPLPERVPPAGELALNPRWVNEYVPLIRPLLMRQDIRLLNGVIAPVAPQASGNIYEWRNYRAKPGGSARQWLDLFTGALVHREKYPKIVGLWQTEAGQPNELCHLWAYPDLNARTAARAAALADPGWQAFIGQSTSLLEEMHSTILLPAPHSPLK